MMIVSPNILAMILGMAIIFLGAFTFYLFQKYLFSRYQRKVGNTMDPGPEAKK